MKSEKSEKSGKPSLAGKEVVPHFDGVAFLSSMVGAAATRLKFRADQPIFQQGSPAHAVFCIVTGTIRLAVMSIQGKEGVIGMLGTGEFFGEGCLGSQTTHIASATAATDSIVIMIEKAAMARVLQDQPAIAEMFTAFLVLRNIRIEADLIDQLFNSSERRLARLLLLLANIGQEGKLEGVIARVSQEMLAAQVGTTRSRISFFMNKFRKLGFIEYNASLRGLKVNASLLNVVIQD